MKKLLVLLLAFSLILCAACDLIPDRGHTSGKENPEESVPESFTTEPGGEQTEPAATATTVPTVTTPAITTDTSPTETTAPPASQKPAHSPYYISGLDTDRVLSYFSEVVLDAEFINSGNADVVQKWDRQISYGVLGAPTQEDRAALLAMASAVNGISGFPGMYEVSDPDSANLRIHFVSQEEMVQILGDNFYGSDGGVTIWWNDSQQIYEGVICIRTDIDQYVRNSVIKEEIYNGLGPLQDTDLRTDSLIWSGYSAPQDMTQVDRLILTLLYHPQIKCGMNAAECEAVIRELYY